MSHEPAPSAPARPSRTRRFSAGLLSLTTMLTPALVSVTAVPAQAASVVSATFGVEYAKPGAPLTLTVNTDSTTKCVEVTGSYTLTAKSDTARTVWTFPVTALATEGVHSIAATSFRGFNGSGKCTANGNEAFGPQSASYKVDGTAPSVTHTFGKAPNGAQWHNEDVAITWSANDGVDGALTATPATDSVAVEGTSTKTAEATDRAGNKGTGSVTVKLDKTAPVVTEKSRTAPNAAGWNSTDVVVAFESTDATSGIKTAAAPQTVSAEGANGTATGTAVDNADNTGSKTVTGIKIDKTAPALDGAIVQAPSGTAADGTKWHNADATVRWTATDGGSGVTAPANSTVAGEGTGRTATVTATDVAGNATTKASPAVNIDRTAPSTDASVPTGWSNTAQTIALAPKDALSGVKATHYTLDGVAGTGTSVAVSGDGVHTLIYWSEDVAGNKEEAKTVEVKVDGTTPTIKGGQTPAANANGWNNGDVTVTFTCEDTGSGIASCTPQQVIATEGKDQLVKGTATDNASNSVSGSHSVSIDKGAPTIKASADRAPNGNGWYDADVTVGFETGDALSGVDRASAAKTLAEGKAQSASGTVVDAAGNEASDGVTGINVDKTAPTLSGKATTAPNAAGWYKGDVTVAWTAGDALSGLDGIAPANAPVAGEGEGLVLSASVKDLAGNVKNAQSEPVSIDRTAPSTSASAAPVAGGPAKSASGWYAGAVDVTLSTGEDLSGVAKTFYSVDGGAAQAYTGTFAHSLKGAHTITFWSEDNAGNVESATNNKLEIKIDGIAPTITGSRAPAANAFGWNNSDVVASFACKDDESGIASCQDAITLKNEGGNQFAEGNALDIAGNKSTTLVEGIRIDRTPPTLSGKATPDANGAGWHKGDVTVAWTGTDGLSGIDPATKPADSTVTGEGRTLGATSATGISDKAGNISGTASVSGIMIDRKAPVITPSKPAANAAGWYTGNVTVGFSCADPALADGSAGSGVAACPSDKLVSGNGANQSVTSDPAKDMADNSAAGVTVGGINIDGLAPQTAADNQCTKSNGYCTGSTATVVLTSNDQPGLSGVKEIRYSVNGGAEAVASGTKLTTNSTTGAVSTSVSVPLDGSGEAGVTFYAVDRADNKEASNGVGLKYDNIAPAVTHTLDPKPNGDEWNNSDVTVTFSAKDNDGGSGVDTARTTAPVKVTADTPVTGQVVNGEAYDTAGNRGTDSVTVKLDRTAPTITGTIELPAGTQKVGEYYNGPVTVKFTCSDALSGVKVCADPVTVTANGITDVTGKTIDAAGNSTTSAAVNVKIDDVKPTITFTGVKQGGIYTQGTVPAATCTAEDGSLGSGVDSCTVAAATGGNANGVGTLTATATAKDNAGNTATATATYRVTYKWNGFLQPITDTAHQTGSISTFKAGSTVPAKFRLSNGAQATVAPNWTTPKAGSFTLAQVNTESGATTLADSGSDYRWDATDKQYIYNWRTSAADAGKQFTIGAQLDDGNTYPVTIALR